MNSLTQGPTAQVLDRLHAEAHAADHAFFEKMMAELAADGTSQEQVIADLIAEEKRDYRKTYSNMANNYLAVSPEYGRFLYMMARTRCARRIVEFGTSMGISTIYLAAAVRDNGGGHVIGTEIEPTKAQRARLNLEAAGVADLVDIRLGDARETLQDVGGNVDMLLIDGAFSLYLPILKLIEPRLQAGAVVLAENAFDKDYQAYVRDPANGYLSQPLPINDGRGNEFAIRLG